MLVSRRECEGLLSMHRFRFILLSVLLFICPVVFAASCVEQARARSVESRIRVAVLDFGETPAGRRAAERLTTALTAFARETKTETRISLIDREQARAAARGNGYAGSLNMTLDDARTLGAAIGCDFFITGDAQTLRRLPSAQAAHYEAYAAIFIVSARTGRLVQWQRPTAIAATPQEAESELLADVDTRARTTYAATIAGAHEREAGERRARTAQSDEVATLEDLSGVEATEHNDLRLPQPYRRLRPPYPETAARYEIEATVDALIDIDSEGEVSRVEISRWAGFGLDEAVIATVRQLHFRPALRDGAPAPVRVLLRYNFRRPPKAK